MRLLVIEDDKKIADFISEGFRQSGFVVDVFSNGLDGLQIGLNESFDAAVIDIMLPGMDGLTVIQELRAAGRDVPVIILSAKRSVEDRVKGLDTGSDDYLTKPFSFTELQARVQALIRRTTSQKEPSRLSIDDLSLDLLSREVKRDNQSIELQPREYSLLEYLLRNQKRVISKTMILEKIWDYHFDPQTNVVDVLICRLRNKIDKDFDKKLLHTLRGVGYVLKSD